MEVRPRVKQAVILCGGLGTRLRPITNFIPKPMVPIGGKPFLEYLIEQLKDNGIEEVVLLTGYKKEVIEDYFGDGSQQGIKIVYSRGEVEWETGKRLYQAQELLEENFLLLYGDNFAQLNLRKLVSFYCSKNKWGVVTVFPREGHNNISLNENNQVTIYDHQRKDPHLDHVEIGYMILNKKVVSLIGEGENCSFSAVLEKLAKSGELSGFVVKDQYYSISDPERLKSMGKYLTEKKMIILDRDGVVNAKAPKGEYITKWEEFNFLPGVISSLQELSKAGYSFVIVSNQAGIARNKLSASELEEIHQKMLEKLKENQVEISKIYVCPHHWEEKCECRKPNPGMLLQASKEYLFRLDHAFFLGDDERDSFAAENSNCRFIMIGENYDPSKLEEYGCQPEFFAKDIEQAKEYILKELALRCREKSKRADDLAGPKDLFQKVIPKEVK